MTKRDHFALQIQSDLKFWFFCFCTLAFYRAAFIFGFHDRIDHASSIENIIWAWTIGFRYDSVVATGFSLFPVLITVSSLFFPLDRYAERVRVFWSGVICFLIAATSILSKFYFEEFNNQFDHFLILFFFDDTTAILRTIWSTYHVILILFTILCLAALFFLFLRWTLNHHFVSPRARCLIYLTITAAALASFYISFEPPRTRLDVVITDDDFLNKAIVNPFISIADAIRDFDETNNTKGLYKYIPDGNIKAAVRVVFPGKRGEDNLDDYLKKVAPGTLNPPPHHVFLIVMESYGAWALLPQYAQLHVSDELKMLARKGITVKYFLPAANNSGESLLSIITGLPNGGLSLYDSSQIYTSSIAVTFRRLGYKTNFFYGGYLRWQNLAEFAHMQGFEAVYGANHMAENVYANEWGIPDEDLFRFVLSKVDDKHPTFNLIFTTSNHPPYSINVFDKGFSLTSAPPMFEQNQGEKLLKILGHQWYSDRCMGSFVKKIEDKFKNVLFAITGDHPSHLFIPSNIGFYKKSVPFVLYGKEVLNGIQPQRDAAGSHIDVGPTLIELAAPRGFVYYSAGINLLRANERHVGIGNDTIVGPSYWMNILGPARIHVFPNRSFPSRLPDFADMKRYYNRMYAIGWWRLKHGPLLNMGRAEYITPYH